MATTPNYGWVMPDPTDFVTDLPADFEIFGDAVDADLAGLLGGTTGQVLTKASATDHDFAFATLSAYSNSITQVATASFTAVSSVSITGLTGYKKYIVRIFNQNLSGGTRRISMQFNSDTGSNYYTSGQNVQTAIELGQLQNSGQYHSNTIVVDFADATTLPKIIYPVSSNSKEFTGATYIGTSAISSIQLNYSSGNFDANGFYYIYGVN